MPEDAWGARAFTNAAPKRSEGLTGC